MRYDSFALTPPPTQVHCRILLPSGGGHIFVVFFGRLHRVEVRRAHLVPQLTDPISSQSICIDSQKQVRRGVLWGPGVGEIYHVPRNIFCRACGTHPNPLGPG